MGNPLRSYVEERRVDWSRGFASGVEYLHVKVEERSAYFMQRHEKKEREGGKGIHYVHICTYSGVRVHNLPHPVPIPLSVGRRSDRRLEGELVHYV